MAEDVREGYVSAQVAREVYRVVLDPQGQVNHEATRALRASPVAAEAGTAETVAWDGQ